MAFHVPNKHRLRGKSKLATDDTYGNNGCFILPPSPSHKISVILSVIASDGAGWEHVSVSTPVRCPKWEEMAYVKSLFWDAEDCVVQFHPPRSVYVNDHPFALHMWRCLFAEIPVPDPLLIGRMHK